MSPIWNRQRIRVGLILALFMMSWTNAVASNNTGAVVYNKYCAPCHGENGDANTLASRALNPTPRDFIQADFVNTLTPERVIDAVRNGRPGTAMVGWQKRLTDGQIEAVSDYVRQRFAKRASTRRCASCQSERDVVKLGEEIYQSRCYFCHGYDGRANTQAAEYLSPSPKNLQITTLSPAALKRVIANGRDGSAMMAFSTVLSGVDIEAVASYITLRLAAAKRAPIAARYHSVENGWSGYFHQVLGQSIASSSASDLDKYGCVACHQVADTVKMLFWQSQADQ